MTEEDEIDILGDFSIDSFLSKNDSSIYQSQNSDILNCDYTVHSQWLLDKPSTTHTIWSEMSDGFNPDLASDNSTFDIEPTETQKIVNPVCTEDNINDKSGWTEKEKTLLKRGIEIFGKNCECLSQFVGSKSASEIRYYFKHFYNSGVTCALDSGAEGFPVCETVVEIPVASEEVLCDSDKKDGTKGKSKELPNKRKELLVKKPKVVKKRKENTAKFKFKAKLNLLKPKLVDDETKAERKIKVGQAEIVTGNGLSVPVCAGEEVIKISKEDPEESEDYDLDIEDSSEQITTLTNTPDTDKIIEDNSNQAETSTESTSAKTEINLSELEEETVQELMSMEVPKFELNLDPNTVTGLEKFIHKEFFEGRFTKTPSRYLKIRNHIINSWLMNKPKYVTKTSVRHGLKNCGDVNCIGRIHCYLEQIGAINFGCAQTSYVRPLYDLLITSLAPVKEKAPKAGQGIVVQPTGLGARPRHKKKFANDGEGGYTLTHDEKGDVVNTLIVNETPVIRKTPIRKPAVQLMYCKPFTEDYQQQYKVAITLPTLLLMDLHSHSSLSEVMGLIGGAWDPLGRTLSISHYEPCRNIASSSTHCDMCPISQAKAADAIHNQSLDILGWFHSHPTFAPEPSQQDMDTQLSLQHSIGEDKPCVGVILSPFGLQGALIASPFRCMVAQEKISDFGEVQLVPYKLKVDVECDEFDLGGFLEEAKGIVEFAQAEGAVLFQKQYFLDNGMRYLDKFISSVKMHLSKCDGLAKMTCDAILQGLLNILHSTK